MSYYLLHPTPMNPTLQLNAAEIAALHQLVQQTGKTEEQLVHEAVTQLLRQAAPGSRPWKPRKASSATEPTCRILPSYGPKGIGKLPSSFLPYPS